MQLINMAQKISGTRGGRVREALLYKQLKGGVKFARQPLHPHNSTMESEQLVVMSRIMEF